MVFPISHIFIPLIPSKTSSFFFFKIPFPPTGTIFYLKKYIYFQEKKRLKEWSVKEWGWGEGKEGPSRKRLVTGYFPSGSTLHWHRHLK